MVYDMTDPGSVDDLENYWINEAYNYCDKTIKVLLVGNKSDCDRGVSQDVPHSIVRELKSWLKSMIISLRRSAPRRGRRCTIPSRISESTSPRPKCRGWGSAGLVPPAPQVHLQAQSRHSQQVVQSSPSR